MTTYLIKHGLLFDGTNRPPVPNDILIEDGVVKAIGRGFESTTAEVIDASGKWITPGFIDTHTHYDAEVLAAPALPESVRHGVTTVVIGNCSISMVLSPTLDCSDLFTRVEAVPREKVLPLLQKAKTWSSVKDYIDFYDKHPLGPNVASFLGHSDLRVAALGLERATDRRFGPNKQELAAMSNTLDDACAQGLLGLSSMTTKWDKVDGDRHRSASLPSTYAKWKEFRALNHVLRRHGRVHQGAPNIVTKWSTLLFLAQSLGWFRRKLKTTLITLMDPKATPYTHWLTALGARLFNRFRADFKWQALPCVFEVYADGMDLVVFEEFGSGEAALHLKDELDRNALLQDKSYRRRFRKDYDKKWGGRVWQRDFHDATIVNCPEATLENRTFGHVADERGIHPVDLFLDLVVAHGDKLRWRTVIANHRPQVLEAIVRSEQALISFSDAGAHIRNMAFYNFPLQMMKIAKDMEMRGEHELTMHHAVHKLTGELADWFGLDAGYVDEGKRADLVIIDPAHFTQDLATYNEAPMIGFDGLVRMVNRNDDLVEHVFINGRPAYSKGEYAPDLGKQRGYGQFLRSQHR